jgi:mannosyltransferase
VPAMALAVWHTHRDRSARERTTATMLGVVGLGTLLLGWLASHIEPSWTIRYLAVAVAPLLLALAGALASTFRGRVTLGLLCGVLAAGSAVGSLLPNANDLVITTQTETLAVLYYYLPKNLIYANPTGVTDQPYVVDWRNIVSRLQQADPCQTLLPALRALPVGAHVLEVNPLRSIGASGSAWNLAANKQVAAVDSLLASQPALVPSASYTQGTKPKPYSAVVAELFTKTAGAINCR